MLAFFFGLISIAQANWGPFPMDEIQYQGAIRQKIHPPCSFYELFEAQQLPENKSLYKIRKPKNAWGTPRLIQTLINASEEVSLLVPKAAPIEIGDLSKEGGGKLKGHKSHQGGSDADIGLFWKNNRKIENDLRIVPPKKFDARSNWVFVRALLDSGEVERILLDQALVNVLRNYVLKMKELTEYEANYIFPPQMKQSIWSRQGVVHHHPGHHHHYHVRVYCNESRINN